MRAFRVEFPETKISPVMSFTVLAEAEGVAHDKATSFVRQGLDKPGWFAYGTVTPVTLEPGAKLASIIQ